MNQEKQIDATTFAIWIVMMTRWIRSEYPLRSGIE